MLKFDNFDLNLTPGTLLENGCRQSLSIMTNFAPLVCTQTEIAGIKVRHFNLELFFEFEKCLILTYDLKFDKCLKKMTNNHL